MGWFLHWLAVHTGSTATLSGPWYNFWSGFGSDIGEVAILGGLVSMARKANCHAKGCWRIGTHEYEKDGVTHKLCHHCHPALRGTQHNRAGFLNHYKMNAEGVHKEQNGN